MAQKKIIFKPISAIVGKFRTLVEKAEVTIIRVNKDILFDALIFIFFLSCVPFLDGNMLAIQIIIKLTHH